MEHKKIKLRYIKYSLACVGLTFCSEIFADVQKLQQMQDEEMSQIHGQALMSLSYIAPEDGANKMRGKGIGFYKLGIEAEMDLNANIKKLQLGCGGVNGAGGCDIDIDHFSLSGASDTRNGRVASSAKFTNPFLEFAIKNPNKSSTREVVGLRISAEKAKGLLTFGLENSTEPNGINQFSGYMKINSTTGTGYTDSRYMKYSDTNQTIDGNVRTNFLLLPLVLGFKSNDYNLLLNSASADIFLDGTTIAGNRLSNVTLNGVANINQIDFQGSLAARLNASFGLLTLNKQVTGNITGLKADITVDQNLGFIHKINVNNPMSISLQNQNIWWPKADASARRGWWMAFDDVLDIGDVSPAQKINITNDVLKQVVGPISQFLTDNPIQCELINCIGGPSLAVGNINLPTTRVTFPLKNLQLKNQNFVPNCYGGLKFC
ncbi:hypothetical protein [Acinetobacter gerneri]|jgi:hypothetical protein|uniref:hypothetical protein n=1 Tax=Acinetobacter gerneri TaxID=202952 RepID=UPI0023EFEE2D|nr:hypothetical protein [Acinetobacter gerneri]MCH4243439.1 hypothetical protein [Acinetobacter gerneri]